MPEYNEDNNIIPEAANTYFAFRSLGYDNTAAIADLIDNSIDADAKNVWISIDNLTQIFISDDGIGMDKETLRQAVRIGGKKEHNKNNELGKYGFGLTAASLSMGKCFRIITKHNDTFSTVVLDYQYIQDNNKFHADFHESTEREIESFNYRTNHAQSGTVLIIDKCDQIQYTKVDSFTKAVRDHIAKAFHEFVKSGDRNIYLNDERIIGLDPFIPQIPTAEVLLDKDITINTTDGKTGILHVEAVVKQDQGKAINTQLRLNIYGQGFYIIRNKRQIASALEFPEIFVKHNDFNLLRIKLTFSQDLDDEMGINIKKQDITPKREVISKLQRLLGEKIKEYRKEAKERQKRKSKTPNPFTPAPTSTTPTPSGGAPSGTQPFPSTSKPKNVNFVSAFAGNPSDPLLKVNIDEDAINIRYNFKNDFYTKHFLSNEYGEQNKECFEKVLKASIKSFIENSGSSSLDSFMNSISNNLE